MNNFCLLLFAFGLLIHPITPETTHKCRDGTVIKVEDWCDGYYNCQGHADELNCTNYLCPSYPPFAFQCINTGQCIPKQRQCDGFNQCSDGSDEKDENCNELINPYEFASKNVFLALWGVLNMLIGIFGNGLTIVAIPYAMHQKRHGLHKSWYSSTIFIIYLAVCDILFCLFGMLDKIIFNLGYKWPFGFFSCNLYIKVVPLIAYASWYGLGFIAVTRACCVFSYRGWNSFCTKSRSILIILFFWVLNIFTSLPKLLEQTKVPYYNRFTGVCEVKDLVVLKGYTQTFSQHLLNMPQYLSFGATGVMIFVSYFLIWLKKRSISKAAEKTCEHNKTNSDNQLTMTILLICVCFVLFVLPLTVTEALNGVVDSNIIIALYWTQYSINFIIYAGRRDSFRKAYIDLINIILPKTKKTRQVYPMISVVTKQTDVPAQTNTEKPASNTDPSLPPEQDTLTLSKTLSTGCMENAFKTVTKDDSPPANENKMDGKCVIVREILGTCTQWVRQNRKFVLIVGLVLAFLGSIFWLMQETKNVNTKLLVIGGWSLDGFGTGGWSLHKYANKVALINLEKSSTCDIRLAPFAGHIGEKVTKFENLPAVIVSAQGQVVDNIPILCGGLAFNRTSGSYASNRCYRMLNQTHWGNIASMEIGRMNFGMAVIQNKILVSGGSLEEDWTFVDASNTNTVELLHDIDSSKWITKANMPRRLAGNCLMALNNEEVMSIGGWNEHFDKLNETWIYNMKNDSWRAGESMSSPRSKHGCSKITDTSGKKYIIVAGGITPNPDGSNRSLSVEIYDSTSNDWKEIDELPKPIRAGQLVEDGKGGVLIVGEDLSSILYLSTKDGIWKKTWKTIDNPRMGHLAMMIPDSFVNC